MEVVTSFILMQMIAAITSTASSALEYTAAPSFYHLAVVLKQALQLAGPIPIMTRNCAT